MEVSFNPLKAIAALPAVLINKSNIEQHEIKGDGKMINGVWYFIPDQNSLEEARRNFKINF